MNIYHRIFKLYQRKIPVQQIAATTHMPIKSVREIIRRFNKQENPAQIEKEVPFEEYLDVHIIKNRKYTLIDLSGHFLSKYSSSVESAFLEIRQQLGATLAIKMDEVVSVDDDTMALLLGYHKELHDIAKNLVLLSPSIVVEQYIDEHKIEDKVKIFGTISAFEEHAFNLSHRK